MLDKLFLGSTDILHSQESSFTSSFSYFDIYWDLNRTLSSKISLESFFKPWYFRNTSQYDNILKKLCFLVMIVKGEDINYSLNDAHLIDSNNLWIKVNLMTLYQLSEEEKLIIGIKMMLIFLICIFRIYLPELCFHHIKVTESFLFLLLFEFL